MVLIGIPIPLRFEERPKQDHRDFRFGQAEAVIQGLESLQCPAVLVGKALAKFQATEWTNKNILQVDSAS